MNDLSFAMSEAHKESLLVLARAHLECYFGGEELSAQEVEELPGRFDGIFVTLKQPGGELRSQAHS